MNRASEGGFSWTDGTTVEYVNWANDQPTDGELDNCVEISPQVGKWSTIQCNSKKNWICKIRKGICVTQVILKCVY